MSNRHQNLPAARRKGQLPTKVCLTCGLPFEWRKKWLTVWDEVRYCSERCRRNRHLNNGH
ncbi:MAG: DUF2256 domain-containing protein [Proteobacteria bacterium]|nr:DUF2256 domain-containing protein [Pseudomonadota bacterium]NBX46610.1 DUF2256 domain-containing protein [Chloroflexota bacterium]NBQ62306.1 DUF2256 domain-containing protein [Pseudomonadota bacterium]NBT03714.1 DUF2256 domain-containing protein [Pseudomonadota bacterium]NBT19290.1 DUF2256 domain-containing protein [Pseudomonadota bacterium]